MGKKPVVKLNLRGINKVMASPGAYTVTAGELKKIATRAGDNFTWKIVPHKHTARGYVVPANAEGAVEEARNKKLTKAVGGGG